MNTKLAAHAIATVDALRGAHAAHSEYTTVLRWLRIRTATESNWHLHATVNGLLQMAQVTSRKLDELANANTMAPTKGTDQ